MIPTCLHCAKEIILDYRRVGAPRFCDQQCYRAYRQAHKKPESTRRATCHPDRAHVAHGLCETCYASWHQKKNQEKHRLSSRKYYLKKHYDLELEDYERLSESQDDRCAICREPVVDRPLDVDHNHATNQIRGLLCVECNTGLGKFKDSVRLLRAATWYLITRGGQP